MAPADGGEAITAYTIERSDDGIGWNVAQADTGSADTGWRDETAYPGTQYDYRVSATNADGTGPASVSAQARAWDGWWIDSVSAGVAEGDDVEVTLKRSAGETGWGFVRVAGTGGVYGNRVEGALSTSAKGAGAWYVLFPEFRGPTGTSKSIKVRTRANGALGEGGTVTVTILPREQQNFGVDRIEPYTATVTVADDEPAGLRIADAAAAEEDGSMAFRVFIHPHNTGTVTVDYATANGTATAGADYTATSGTLTFLPGETEKTVSVPVLADAAADAGEKFTLTLGNASGAVIVDGAAAGTIHDTTAVAVGAVTGFRLVDGASGADLGAITAGAELAPPDPYGGYRITAVTGSDVSVGSVSFALAGTKSATRVDDSSPFGLFDGAGHSLPAGPYTLSATAYAEHGARGDALGTLAVSFTVAVGTPPTGTELAGFTLTDTGSGATVGPLADASTFTLPAAGRYRISAELTAGATVGSVRLELSGPTIASRTDNDAPYELFGAGRGLAAGAYTVRATAYAAADRGGAVLQALTASFTVEAALTARLEDVPVEHDGGPFAFRVRFSEDVPTGDAAMLAAFAVTGGTATAARRVDGAAGLREIDVAPSSAAMSVTVSLAVPADCAADGAVCTSDGRKLWNAATATVAWVLSATVADAAGMEGGTASFAVRLSGAWTSAVTVDYATRDADAKAGSDYTATSGTLTFAAGVTEQTVSVALTADGTADDGEVFWMVLSNPSVVRVAGNTPAHELGGFDEPGVGRGTIRDSAAPSALSAYDAAAREGPAAAVAFAVFLSPASTETVVAAYATSDGTAMAGSDYVATSGTLTFGAGQTLKFVQVPVVDDDVEDSGETFGFTLSDVTGASLAQAAATGTIWNSEAPALSVADAVATGGADAALAFVVALSPAATETVTVDYATHDGTARAGEHYTGQSGTLTFAVGETAKTLSVPITGDGVGGTLTLALANASGAVLADAAATGTIRSDRPSLSVADAEATEEDAALEFAVTLDAASTAPVTVDYATSDGTATAGSDYTATQGTLTFAPGETSKTLSVPIADDEVEDGGETLTLTLGNADGATLADATATGTIGNAEPADAVANDAPPAEDETLGPPTPPGLVVHWPVAAFNHGDVVAGKTYDLWGARYVDSTRNGAKTYALVTATFDAGVQIVDITDPASPVPVASFDNGETVAGKTYQELGGADDVVVVEIGSKTYALVVGTSGDGVQIVDVTDPTSPAPVAAFDDGDTVSGKTFDELDGATAITIVEIGSGTYALVAASDDDGVQIVDITDPASPVPAASFDDGDTVDGRTYDELDGAVAITTARIGSGTYALVAASDDDGVQIVDITDPASPVPVASFDDGDTVDGRTYDELDDPRWITTARIGSSTYALVASYVDDGVQIIDITDPASPVPVASFGDGDSAGGRSYDALSGAGFVTAIGIGSRTYALVVANRGDGVQIADISDPANPLPVAAIKDGDTVGGRTYENLDGATNIETVKIGFVTYVLVTAIHENGVQIIGLKEPPSVDAGHDLIVEEGETATLSGTASDPENAPLTVRWTHDSDLSIGLADDTALATSFTAPAVTSDTTVTFTLAVSDGATSASDTVSVTISNNDPPTVDAGRDQTVREGETVTLSGTASDPENDPLTIQWTHDSSLSIGLADDTALSTSFTAPAVAADTTATFTLAAADDTGAASDTVAVTIAHNTLAVSPPAEAWGDRRPEKDIALDAVSRPTGIWGSAETLWIAAWGEYDVYAYDFAGNRVPDEDLTLASGGFPNAMWSDGTTLWMADHFSGVQAHGLADGSRVADEDFGDATSTAGNDAANGLWSDGTTMRVADRVDGDVYAYALSDKTRQTDAEFSLGGVETFKPFGLWSDGEVVLSASWHDAKVHAFRMADGGVLPALEIDTGAVGNTRPFGLWSDGDTLWVVDDAAQKAFAYAMPGLGGDGGEDEVAEVAEVSIAADASPVSEGTAASFTLTRTGDATDALTVAVSVSESGAMASGALPTQATFAADASTAALTVATTDDAVVEASSTVTASVTPDAGYAVAAEGGSAEVVVQDDDAATFAVTLSAQTVAEGASATLTVSIAGGVTFAAEQTVTLTATGTAAAEDYTLSPTTLTLAAGDAAVSATVTATDDEAEEPAETVVLTASHGGTAIGTAMVTIPANDTALSDDATLAALTLSGLDIGTFDAATTDYTATAAESVAETTVTATPNDADASVTISDADGSTSGTTRSVALGYGANTVTAAVTAADGQTTKAYTVTVTRAYTLPTATIAAGTSPVAEGTAASFTVRLDKPAKDALTVAVTVTETGEVLSGTASSVAIAEGETQATLNLGTEDDSVVEGAGTVTVALTAGDGYAVGTADAAEVSVTDDDAATFEVSAAPSEIEEGDATTVTVSIANGVTFAAGQTVTLTASGTAATGDYTLDPTTLTLGAGESSVSSNLTATDDEAEEPAETVTLTARHGGAEIGTATVTIAANDTALSADATLAALTLSELDIGTFAAATADYTATAAESVAATTVTATPTDADASVTISDVDGSTSGTTRGVALGYGANAITATVTAADGETTAAYTVTVTRPRPPLTASLHNVPERHDGGGDIEFELRLSEEIELSYQTVRAGYEVEGGTLLWTRRKEPPGNVRWRVGVQPEGDAEVVATLPGNQPCGTAGAVCAADGRMLSNSPVARISGPLPVVSIAADGSPLSEGTAAAFTLTRTGDAAAALTVAVSVSESGAMAAADAPSEAMFAASASTAALSVATTDDAVVEASSTVTAAVTPATGYAVAAEGGSAAVVVEDDDAATFAVELSAASVSEGASATLTVSVTNAVTFAEAQTIGIAASGTASAADYRPAGRTARRCRRRTS